MTTSNMHTNLTMNTKLTTNVFPVKHNTNTNTNVFVNNFVNEPPKPPLRLWQPIDEFKLKFLTDNFINTKAWFCRMVISVVMVVVSLHVRVMFVKDLGNDLVSLPDLCSITHWTLNMSTNLTMIVNLTMNANTNTNVFVNNLVSLPDFCSITHRTSNTNMNTNTNNFVNNIVDDLVNTLWPWQLINEIVKKFKLKLKHRICGEIGHLGEIVKKTDKISHFEFKFKFLKQRISQFKIAKSLTRLATLPRSAIPTRSSKSRLSRLSFQLIMQWN